MNFSIIEMRFFTPKHIFHVNIKLITTTIYNSPCKNSTTVVKLKRFLKLRFLKFGAEPNFLIEYCT